MKYLLITIVAGFASIAASTANADVLPDGNGGALCKNTKKHPGSCTLLAVECKGTYTEYVDPNGTVYGKCTQVKRTSLKLKSN